MMTSAQDLRNQYEKFYAEFRNYLWPYEVLEDLAEFEVDIYSAFFDVEKLKRDFEKLRKPVLNVNKDFEDAYILKTYDNFSNIIDQIEPDHIYQSIGRVEEVHPDEDKQIKSEELEDSEGEFDTEVYTEES